MIMIATNVLDIADVDRVMRNADGSLPMTKFDMIDKAAGQCARLRNRIGGGERRSLPEAPMNH